MDYLILFIHYKNPLIRISTPISNEAISLSFLLYVKTKHYQITLKIINIYGNIVGESFFLDNKEVNQSLIYFRELLFN